MASSHEGSVIFVTRFWHKHARRWVYPRRGRVIRIVLRKGRKARKPRPKRSVKK